MLLARQIQGMGKKIGGRKMRKERLYVIGYDGDEEYVYGKKDRDARALCLPITAVQTKRELKFHDDTVKIYKLVEVSPEEL